MANKIALGQIDCGIAGGVDTTSDAPIGVNEGLRQILLQINRSKGLGDKLKTLLQLRPGQLKPELPRNGEPRTGLSMGQHCELMAQTWNIPRDEQDQLALDSHRKLAAAYAEGWHDDLLTPFLGLTRDNNLRPDLSLEKLAALKPVFERSARGTLTAGNSTPLTDGASLVLLGSEDWARERGLPVLAYLRDGEAAAVDFVKGAEGLLMAPVYALGSIDRSRLNVKGSSLAAGHPFAATGGRIVANLAKLLDRAGQGRGLISICAAGGQGVTAIIER